MSENNVLVPSDNSIQWCLLSHTNIGKTTLTRTLMADDVGEIEDAAHVTMQSQRYLLQKTQQMQIMLPHRCRARLARQHRQAETSPHHMRIVASQQWAVLHILHGNGAVPALPPGGALCRIQRHMHICCAGGAPASVKHAAQQMCAGARPLPHRIGPRPGVL